MVLLTFWAQYFFTGAGGLGLGAWVQTGLSCADLYWDLDNSTTPFPTSATTKMLSDIVKFDLEVREGDVKGGNHPLLRIIEF